MARVDFKHYSPKFAFYLSMTIFDKRYNIVSWISCVKSVGGIKLSKKVLSMECCVFQIKCPEKH